MKTLKVVLDTDLFVDHLVQDDGPSLLRLALQRFFCYTTVFQAIELFALGKTVRDRQAMEDSMAAVKILGMNAKNAPAFGRLVGSAGDRHLLSVLSAGLCIEGRLPLVTGRVGRYRGTGIRLIPSGLLRKYETGDEILKAAARRR